MTTSIDAAAGDVLIRLGRRFDAPEADRVADAVLAFGPLSRLTVDFTRVSDFRDSAVAPFARTLVGLTSVEVVLRGMTRHQYRLLRYLGVAAGLSPRSERLDDGVPDGRRAGPLA